MLSSEIINKVWERTPAVDGYNPNIWKKDMAGAWIRRDLYGLKSRYGWEVDHIKPSVMGGTDQLDNLQALHWQNNRCKADSFPIFTTRISSEGNGNKEKQIRWRISND